MNNINQMMSRVAMGLPETYKSAFLEEVNSHIKSLKNKSDDELIEILSIQTSSFEERWSAGVMLALLGDPRINPFNPEMLSIPASKTFIGATENEINIAYAQYKHLGVKREWLLKECPKHEVEISAFNIAKFPVSNFEYLMFLKETGHTDIPFLWNFGIYDLSKANHPVCGILPESADKYANWLSEKTGRSYRLPNEYEWEYAAAGENRNEFPWGDVFLPDRANTLESGIYSTTPVGIFPGGASSFGCMDMAGNVEEYVRNNYFVYPNGIFVNDDLGKDYRIARGGSFTRHADLARCRRRHGAFKKDIYVMGFRLVEAINI